MLTFACELCSAKCREENNNITLKHKIGTVFETLCAPSCTALCSPCSFLCTHSGLAIFANLMSSNRSIKSSSHWHLVPTINLCFLSQIPMIRQISYNLPAIEWTRQAKPWLMWFFSGSYCTSPCHDDNSYERKCTNKKEKISKDMGNGQNANTHTHIAHTHYPIGMGMLMHQEYLSSSRAELPFVTWFGPTENERRNELIRKTKKMWFFALWIRLFSH